MKTYSHAPDPSDSLEKIQAKHHAELDGVTIAALFVFDTESSEPVLKHQGYAAAATARITPLKDRAMGLADAAILIDRATWLTLSQRQRDALLDHELTHFVRVLDKDSGTPICDALDRPKLAMRPHDHQFGWFDEVAQRHGDASPEVRQARRLMDSSGQLYFDFSRTTLTKGTLGDGTTFTAERVETPADDEGDEDEDATKQKPKRNGRARARKAPKPANHLNA